MMHYDIQNNGNEFEMHHGMNETETKSNGIGEDLFIAIQSSKVAIGE
jgi:hypothetical protein